MLKFFFITKLQDSKLKYVLDSTTQKPSKKTTTEYKPVINKFHTVYSVIGKRSIPNPRASYAEKFYSDHHRSTRHALYRIIEKYLFA